MRTFLISTMVNVWVGGEGIVTKFITIIVDSNLLFKKFEWMNMKFIRLIYYYLIKRNSNKFNYYSIIKSSSCIYDCCNSKKDVRKGKKLHSIQTKSNLEWNYKRVHHKIFVKRTFCYMQLNTTSIIEQVIWNQSKEFYSYNA